MRKARLHESPLRLPTARPSDGPTPALAAPQEGAAGRAPRPLLWTKSRSPRAVRASAEALEKGSGKPFPGAMETVGIEPTSAGALRTASTSVAGALCLAPRLPLRQGSEGPAS